MSVDLVLNDRYRLLEQLAVGGMGEVWRGTDEMLSRPVAIKLLRKEHVSDEAARTRFRDEARYAAALQHGGIAQVYDYGEQDETAYLVMELVPGRSLSKELVRAGRLDPEQVVDLVAQAARALQIAHSAGIIHRDIKPANLMITANGTLKITDFGIARGSQVSDLTQTGMVMGTVHYLSPEQASGKKVTGSSDLYSLGVVAYECLAGKPPFDADTPVAVALKHVSEPAPELPGDVPEPVRDLVDALLEKDPADRPVDAREAADRAYLIQEALRTGTPVTGTGTGLAETGLTETGLTGTRAVRSTGGPAPDTLPSDGLDDELDGEAAGGRAAPWTKRSPLFLASMALGMLILGGIVVGSLLQSAKPAEYANENGGRTPVQQDQGPAGRTILPSPNDPFAPNPNSNFRDPAGLTTTTPSGSPSPSGKPRRTPTPTPTNLPEPTPTPPETTTPPPSPDPDPSSSAGGVLGSGT